MIHEGLIQGWETPVLGGWSHSGFSSLQVDNAFTRGFNSLGESGFYLVGHKTWLESGPPGLEFPSLGLFRLT